MRIEKRDNNKNRRGTEREKRGRHGRLKKSISRREAPS